MATLADAFVRLRPDTSKFGPELKAKTEATAATTGKSAGKKFGGSMVAGIGGVLAAGAVVGFFKGAFDEAREAARIGKLTEAVIKSTGGAAHVTAAQVDRLATRLSNLSGVDDELIANSENVLLTFTKVRNEAGKGNDIFNQGTEAALNLSAALGTDLQSATILVGKALNDPVKGLTALQKAGIQFTAEQKEQIKAMVASGDTMGAQKIILGELTTQFGGAAKAAADPAKKAQVAWSNFQEMVGTKLLPVIEKLLGFIIKQQKWLFPLAAAIGVATAALWLLNVAMAANPIGLLIVGIGLLVAALIWVATQTRFFQTVWEKTWEFLKTIGAWFAGPFVGFFTGAWNKIVGAAQFVWDWFKRNWPLLLGILTGPFGLAVVLIIKHWDAIKGGLKAGWDWVVNNVFNPIKNFITKTIPDAFRDGVATVGKWWDGLKEIAAKPVRFVINTVINDGIIGGINWVAGKVGVKGIPKVPLPKGLGDGPGPRGAGDGIGDLFKGAISPIANPARWLTDRLSGPIGSIKAKFGDNPFTSMLVGAGKKTLGFGVEKIKSLLSFLDFGAAGRGVGAAAAGALGAGSFAGLAPGISAVLADLRSVFGAVGVISGYRPGARTLSGNVSYHASGRAIDIAPVLGWAQYLRYAWGPRLRELITPWNALNILNGQPHTYTGAVWAQHNFAGGNAHIHAAFDQGGFLLPGLNIVPNNTGRPEPVTPAATMDDMVGLLRALIVAVERVAPGLAAELYGGAVSLRQAARVR